MDAPPKRSGNPILDEPTFQKLLAAAYIVQQHNEQTRAADQAEHTEEIARSEHAGVLTQVVEIQHKIFRNHLDLSDAADLVVEKICRITGASGAALGLLDHGHVVYRSISGIAAAE